MLRPKKSPRKYLQVQRGLETGFTLESRPWSPSQQSAGQLAEKIPYVYTHAGELQLEMSF